MFDYGNRNAKNAFRYNYQCDFKSSSNTDYNGNNLTSWRKRKRLYLYI